MRLVAPAVVAVVAVLVSALAPAAGAQGRSAKKAYVADPIPWEHESSDLEPDPRCHFGALKNGLRWVWVQNAHPPKQILLRLHLNVGSLAEERDELGIAHFIEHLAFNGSKGFKAGTLVPFFQGQGIRFGSDVNAHTSFEETVYELDLPDGEPKRLEKALLWFRDVIDGLALLPAEIEAEKGVIDAEETVRSGRGQDLFVERIDALLAGSRYPRRFPIGERAVRAKFDKKTCAGFYDRWYRPDNFTFLMVGDFDDDPTARIEKAFGDAAGRGEWEAPPGDDREHLTFERSFFSSPMGGADVQLYAGRVSIRRPAPDDSASRQARLALALAGDVLAERLNAIVPRPFVLASFGSGDSFHLSTDFLGIDAVDGVSLALTTTDQAWPGALMHVEREVRRLLATGIADDEWKAALARLDRKLEPRPPLPPQHSGEILDQLLRACNLRHVPMEERAAKELARGAARRLDAKTCLRAFADAWSAGRPFVCTEGGLDLRDAAREMFTDAWSEAERTGLESKLPVREDLSTRAPPRTADGSTPPAGAPDPIAKGDATRFAYALPDSDARPKSSEALEGIGGLCVELDNGVRALLKHVPGSGRGARLEVRIGDGMSALEPARADVAKVASLVFLELGARKNGIDDLRAALTAAKASLGFEVEGDACTFSASAGGADCEAGLRRALEVIVALLREPAFSKDAFDRFQKELDGHVLDLDLPHFRSGRAAFDRLLADGDPRVSPLEPESAAKVTLDDVKAFLEPQLAGPIEVTIVGELFTDKLSKLVASTLGQLERRPERAAIPESRLTLAAPRTGLDELRGVIDLDGSVTLLHIAYPCPDAVSAASERTLEIFGDVIDDRLRAEIREKLGTTYSPDGSADGDLVWRGRGFVRIDVQVEPQLVAKTREACLAAMDALARGGVKKDEFERIRAARAGNPTELARSFGFWLRQLRRCHREPALLTELRDLARWYDSVALADVDALAKSVLPRKRASVLRQVPR